MNIITQIETPESGGCVAIFFETITERAEFERYKSGEPIKKLNTKKHCELFAASNLSSAGLNKKSVVLRFTHADGKKSIKLYHNENRDLVKKIAGLLETSIGGGLKVKQYYATLFLPSEKQNSNND